MQNNTYLKSQFLLRPDITYLNFGSFGSCVKPVFEEYQKIQLELEHEPAQFIQVNGPGYLKKSREALADYIDCDADDLVYVTNPSYAVNIVAKSLNLKEGDEILTTNIEYGASDKAWQYYCNKANAKYIRQTISLPLISKEKFIEEFFSGLSEKTKLIFISHITSSTALILPVKEICERANKSGILCFVDGAHVPGHIDLDLGNLNPDIYTGACHKWMMTPKGSSFFYVRKSMQNLLDPLIVSWGYGNEKINQTLFLDYHQMQGTRDFSAFLTIPRAIQFMEENNWKEVSRECKSMVIKNAPRFFELLNAIPLSPLTDEFLGQMISLPVKTSEPEKLQRHLFENYKIEIPVMRHGEKVYIRYSINAFNSQTDLDKLFDVLSEIKNKTDLIGNF